MAPIATSTPVEVDSHSFKSTEPTLAPWVEPPTTKEDLAWANLETIDLSLLDSSDLEVKQALYVKTKKALGVDGFILVSGLGVDPETIIRQQAINQLVTTGTPLEEKQKYLAHMAGGDYTGYKLKGSGGPHDHIEFFNLATKSYSPGYPLPSTIVPYIDEVEAFGSHTYNYIIKRILILISRVLELPDDYLWDLHDQNQPLGTSSQRFMTYYFPEDIKEQDTFAKEDTFVKGHTDFNTISLLFNQPISALQVQTPEGEWKWVKYVPGTAVVNVADALDFLTGGVLKATRHRVVRPPKDQRDWIRYILINFARARYDVELKPIEGSPVVQREGKHAFPERVATGGRAPTQGEWLAERIKGVQKRLGEYCGTSFALRMSR
ncbi:hypothetical protein N7495_000241 [Penicillium taxi]|uniref:uncharacterized protein n=1 Tax=Penicillium taxi TaxID=168475 RepID=UPI0025455D3F|nr:uncharacterized protein N7495_000241 [Penicillium taxi]KAJ5907559.1 hypothetical protein N7495_000241 [Penicillium taxi]